VRQMSVEPGVEERESVVNVECDDNDSDELTCVELRWM